MDTLARLQARVDEEELKARGIAVEVRKYNPAEPRIPGGRHGGGEWTHGVVGAIVHDVLRLAQRIDLSEGETLVGSAAPDPDDSPKSAVMAVVRGPKGPRLRLGMVWAGDEHKWSAGNKGGTVELDAKAVDGLHERLSGLAALSDRRAAELWKSYDANMARQRKLNDQVQQLVNDTTAPGERFPNMSAAQLAQLKDWQDQAFAIDRFDYSHEPDVDETFAEEKIRAGWGDLAIRAGGTDDEHNRWVIDLDVVQHGSGDEPFASDSVQLDAKSLRSFLAALAEMRALMTHPEG